MRRVLVAVWLGGCAAGQVRHPPHDSADTEVDSTDTDSDTTAPGPCPSGMVLVDERFCVDAYEAYLVDASPYLVPTGNEVAASAPGAVPQAYISGSLAASTCANAGKRLCTSPEWLLACQGPSGSTWPYGEAYEPGACNEGRAVHPVVQYFGTSEGVWDPEHMNDPGINQQADTVDPAGANPRCVSHWGAFDLHGNLHEWVADPDGTFRGGFYVDARINGEGCLYRTTAHAFGYHDYSTGFRCCSDL